MVFRLGANPGSPDLLVGRLCLHIGHMKTAAIKSPCVKVCVVDGPTGWCLGCGRTLKEISQWSQYTDQQRDDVMVSLKARMDELRAKGKLG